MTTSIKTCRDCGVEHLITRFYPHPQMADGYLNKCKECVKSRVRDHRKANLERIREYDRSRAMQPHRVDARMAYARTEQGKLSQTRATTRSRTRYPKHYAARNAVSYAVRTGRLVKPMTCENCEALDMTLHGHHDDYDKPLDVRWLCAPCHSRWHSENGARNA